MLASRNLEIVRQVHFDPQTRLDGSYMGAWPPEAETMIGVRRLDDIERCMMEVLNRGVSGDFLEAGVWRGGAAIFMRAVLKAYHQTDRVVWVADSFQGLPTPQVARYREDEGDNYWAGRNDVFRVSLEHVKANFARYDLLDDQVRFLAGWFHDTLPTAPIERLAVMRLDSDMYSSTMDTLSNLYPKLSIGGYVIIDDYRLLPRCGQAVDDFRTRLGIDEELQAGGWNSVFWMRLK
jgi:O-methyltransferase